MKIECSFDCTEEELMLDLCTLVASTIGFKLQENITIQDIIDSTNPRMQAVLFTAESIYELFTGDSPTYSGTN